MQNLLSTIAEWATGTGIKIVVALVVLLIAFRIIDVVGKRLGAKLSGRQKLDETLTRTLIYAFRIALKIVVVACLVGYLGIETSGISAVIASLGVTVGLAVNGTLANLAGGVMLLITRPFKIGDYIIAQGNEGSVEDIRICYTKIVTIDNKVVWLPNSSLSTGTIVNCNGKDLRRVDLTFSVGGNDPVKVRKLLLDVCANTDKVLQEPAPFARITDYGAGNGVKLQMRAWCHASDYWDAYFNLLDGVQQSFDANGVVVPFNQLDVHIKND